MKFRRRKRLDDIADGDDDDDDGDVYKNQVFVSDRRNHIYGEQRHLYIWTEYMLREVIYS